jgi:hypothetical protein
MNVVDEVRREGRGLETCDAMVVLFLFAFSDVLVLLLACCCFGFSFGNFDWSLALAFFAVENQKLVRFGIVAVFVFCAICFDEK